MSINETEESENEEITIERGDAGFLQHDLNETDLTQHSQRRSTKEPLPKDRKRKVQQRSKEDIMLDEAMSILAAKKNKVMDADETFGQNVTASLRNIPDNRCKEFVKVKIQELIFQAQFGMLSIHFPQANVGQGALAQYSPQHYFPYVYQRDIHHPVSGQMQSPARSSCSDNNSPFSGVQ